MKKISTQMKQKISKWEIFRISALISGAICLFAVLVIGIASNYSLIKYKIFGTGQAYGNSANWALIDATDSYGDCVSTLGGTWTLGTKTCDVSSPVTISNKTLVVSGGATLNGNGNVTVQFTSALGLYDVRSQAIIVEGAPLSKTPLTSTVDDVIVNTGGYLDYGVMLEGVGATLSNSTVSNATTSNILVAQHAGNFTLQSNTTSGGPIGVEVKHWTNSGTGNVGIIDDQNSSSHTSYGIEIYGSDAVEVTNSTLNNNGIYGLYIHDVTWSVKYGNIYGNTDVTVNNTYNYVDGNTITGNTSYDIAVDVTDANAWDAAQYTTASNTYSTLYEINGEFPEAPSGPPVSEPDPPASGFPTSDTFNLTVEVNDYQAITTACSGAMSLEVPIVGGALSAQDGKRYGSDSCQIEIIHNDPTKNFQVDVNKTQPGALSDGTNTFDDIVNASGADCVIDTSGDTEDEEYGYRLENVLVVSGVNVETDATTECNGIAYNSTGATSPNEYLFDIEYEFGDTVITSTGLSPAPTCLSGDCTFDLKVAANVDWNTYADTTYSQFSTVGNYTIDVATSVIP